MRVRVPLVAGLVAVVMVLGLAAPAQAAGEQDGVAFTGWWNDAYDGQPPEDAMTNLAGTDAGWVSTLSTWYQNTSTSTHIAANDATPTDDGVVHMIQTAHDLGLNVMLKPHVDLSSDPDHWRGQIGTGWKGKPEKWRRWFRSYRRFIFHFAVLAEANGVEQLAVGTELAGTTGKQQQWRRVVAGVRERFTGTLVYASTVGGEETRIRWWDAVDLIGVDAYYDLTDQDDPTVQDLKDAWAPHVQDLADLSAAWGDEPIVFTEIGYRSIDGANRHPWDWQTKGSVDLQEQADCYRAALESVWNETWFAGMFWWDWSSDPAVGGDQDTGYTPAGKPAEDVLRTWY